MRSVHNPKYEGAMDHKLGHVAAYVESQDGSNFLCLPMTTVLD